MSKQNSQTPPPNSPNNGKNETIPKTTTQVQPLDPKLKQQSLLRISPQSQTWNPIPSQQPIYGSFPPQIQNRPTAPPPSTKTAPFQQQQQGSVYQQQNYSKFRTIPSGTINNPSNLQSLQSIPSYKVQDPKKMNLMNVPPPVYSKTPPIQKSSPSPQAPPPSPPKMYQIPNKFPYQKSTTYQQYFQKPNQYPAPNPNLIQQGQLYNPQGYMMNQQQNVYRNNYTGNVISQGQNPQQLVYQSQPNQGTRQLQNNFSKPLEPKKKTNKKKRLVLDPDEEDLDIFDDEESEEEFDDPNDKDFETKKIAPKPTLEPSSMLEKSSESEEASEEEVDFENLEEKNETFLSKFSQDFDSNRNLRTKKKTDYGLESSTEESEEDSELDLDHQKTSSELIEEEDEEIIEFVLNHRNKETEVLIKWKGWANIHNTWNSVDELIHHKGFKKVENYLKKVKEIENWKKIATPEEIEHHLVYEQLDFDLHEDYKKIERIIGKRPARHAKNFVNSKQEEGLKLNLTFLVGFETEFLIKWKSLPYSDCTWEYQDTIKNSKEFLEYKEIEGYTYPNISLKRNPNHFKKIEKQPESVVGGQLRDYQLESLNWMYYSWLNKK
jgi:hypothetical protein